MDYFERRRQSLYNYYSEDYNDDYINDIIVENYIDSDYEFVSEGIGDIVDSIKEKINNAIKKIQEIWQKFKNWIKNLFNVIVNMFTSGKKLVENHESDIREAYARKKNTIKFHGHLYSLRGVDELSKSLNEITGGGQFVDMVKDELRDIEGGKQAYAADKASLDNMDKILIQEFTDNHASTKEELLKMVANAIRSPEKKNHTLADVNIDDLIDVAGRGKDVIKTLKQCEKDSDKMFKEAISAVKGIRSENSEDKEAVEVINAYLKGVKSVSGIITSVIKQMISTIKEGNRAYTALVRKLLDGRIKGSDDDDDNEAPKNEPPKNEPPKADTNKPDPNGGNRGLRGAKRYVELQKQKTNDGRQSKYHK